MRELQHLSLIAALHERSRALVIHHRIIPRAFLKSCLESTPRGHTPHGVTPHKLKAPQQSTTTIKRKDQEMNSRAQCCNGNPKAQGRTCRAHVFLSSTRNNRRTQDCNATIVSSSIASFLCLIEAHARGKSLEELKIAMLQ